ncbi:hypothetical protein [Paenibacillus sp. GCM10012306]
MDSITALNQHLEGNSQEIESMITELVDREECACTANGCGADACGVK